jgi:hypothetical protein
MRTRLQMLGWMFVASLIASCGLRTAITPEADDQTDLSGLDAGMPCGFGPPCNVNDFGGRTCEMLGLGAGDLVCDPKTCNLVLKGCGPAANTTPGQTGMEMGGTGGQMDVPGLFTGTGTGGAAAFPGGAFFGGGTGGAGANFFGGGTGGSGAFPGANFFGGGQNNSDEDGGVPANPGFFGGAFFGGN